MDWALDFSHVGTRRGLTDVLHNLTLKIKAGESVTLLGPNGSGKSTLIKLITRELYPTSGRLKIYGREGWDLFDLRSQLGIVSNDLQQIFLQEMTGLEAVLSGFFSSVGLWDNNHVTPQMKSKALKALKSTGLFALRDRPMNKLSSGEARRLLIARALIHSPRSLIFDEPTNSLDLKAQHDLRQILRRLARLGTGLILATHHLPDIIPEIKRVIVLKAGRLVADGPKEEILRPEILRKLFNVPISVVKKDGLYHTN